MKFLADMGISPRSAAFLRGLGYDAIHLHDEGLDRLSDANILAKARTERRIVLTHDLDFGELVAASKAQLPSVVTFRLRNMAADHVNRYLEIIGANYQERLEAGAVISVTERQIRVRTHRLLKYDAAGHRLLTASRTPERQEGFVNAVFQASDHAMLRTGEMM